MAAEQYLFFRVQVDDWPRCNEIPLRRSWHTAFKRMGRMKGHGDLNLWPLKLNQFNLKSKRTIGPNLKKCPQGVPKISLSRGRAWRKEGVPLGWWGGSKNRRLIHTQDQNRMFYFYLNKWISPSLCFVVVFLSTSDWKTGISLLEFFLAHKLPCVSAFDKCTTEGCIDISLADT